MKNTARKVWVFVFDKENAAGPEQRIFRCVEEYCRMSHLPDIAKERLRIERTEQGKPYFPDCPEIKFSISHSGSYWACAFSSSRVGLDLQEHVRLKSETREAAAVRFQKMAVRFFHPLEARFVARNSYCHFFAVWASREAYVKYTGQGIDASFSEHCVVPQEDNRWEPLCEAFRAGSEIVWQAQGVWFWQRRYEQNYSLCICTEEQNKCEIVNCVS